MHSDPISATLLALAIVLVAAKFGGHVVQSSLSNEQETALQEALDNRGASA